MELNTNADPKFKTLDMSRSRTIGCGGDGMNKWQSIIIDEKLMEQGSRFKVTNGYGASELGAPFSTGTYKYNKPGSVGFPLPGNEIINFKEGTVLIFLICSQMHYRLHH